MSTAQDFRTIAMSLEGTAEAPHFDRTAFKVKRIYASLAADGRTANLNFTPDEQEFKCMLAPDSFKPIENAWGRSGWTTVILSKTGKAELRAALEMAWEHGRAKAARKR